MNADKVKDILRARGLVIFGVGADGIPHQRRFGMTVNFLRPPPNLSFRQSPHLGDEESHPQQVALNLPPPVTRVRFWVINCVLMRMAGQCVSIIKKAMWMRLSGQKWLETIVEYRVLICVHPRSSAADTSPESAP